MKRTGRWLGSSALLSRLLLAATLASMAALSIASPGAACLAGGAEWPSRLSVRTAVVGTVLSRWDDSDGWLIRVDHQYRGGLDPQFRLTAGGTCNFPAKKMQRGQRVFFVSGYPTERMHWWDSSRQSMAGADLWFLDSADHVTGSVSGMFDDHFRDFGTLQGIIEAMGIPDTAMDRRPDWTTFGLLLLILGGGWAAYVAAWRPRDQPI